MKNLKGLSGLLICIICLGTIGTGIHMWYRSSDRAEILRVSMQETVVEEASLNAFVHIPLSQETQDMIEFIMHRNYKIYPGMAEEIAIATVKASVEFNVPSNILLAIMDIESDYRYDAVSKATAVGLMQIHVATWLDSKNKINLMQAGIADSKKDLFDPDTNIRAGAYILQMYMKEGIRKKEANHVQYAATRYFGGTKNTYYAKLIAALGEYQIFNCTHIMQEAQVLTTSIRKQDSDNG